MVHINKFQYVIIVGLIFMCGTCSINAQIWFDSSSNQTTDSSSTRPINEASNK